MPYPIDACSSRLCRSLPSSEIQAQTVEARESLNGRKNKARRKVKNSEKSSSGRSLLFFCAIFSRLFRLSSPPLSARGSPRTDLCFLCMPEDPGYLGTSLKPLLQALFSVVSVASGVMALDRHFGEYVTLADAQVRPTQRIL